jgi:hypothetical protein
MYKPDTSFVVVAAKGRGYALLPSDYMKHCTSTGLLICVPHFITFDDDLLSCSIALIENNRDSIEKFCEPLIIMSKYFLFFHDIKSGTCYYLNSERLTLPLLCPDMLPGASINLQHHGYLSLPAGYKTEY